MDGVEKNNVILKSVNEKAQEIKTLLDDVSCWEVDCEQCPFSKKNDGYLCFKSEWYDMVDCMLE